MPDEFAQVGYVATFHLANVVNYRRNVSTLLWKKVQHYAIGISKQYCKHIEEHNDHVPTLVELCCVTCILNVFFLKYIVEQEICQLGENMINNIVFPFLDDTIWRF